jgi:hypothetical protein
MLSTMGVQRVFAEQSDLEATASEKMNYAHTEQVSLGRHGLKPEDAEFLANFSEASHKKVLRKIDVKFLCRPCPRSKR